MYYIFKYDFKNPFIRKKGHVFKSEQKFILKNRYLSEKELFIYNSFKNISVKIKNNLSFKIISTGNEFTKNHFINPTNASYLVNYLNSHNQKIDKNIHIKDDQKILEKPLLQENISDNSPEITISENPVKDNQDLNISSVDKEKLELDLSEFDLFVIRVHVLSSLQGA